MNSKTVNGVKWFLYLLGLLALSAQGASFDCGKASTKIEHLICDNPEISKLDDELSVGYKGALQDQLKAEAIKQAQKQWMKERNGCADVACVRSAYQKRIEQLHPSPNTTIEPRAVAASQQATKSGEVNADATASAKKYPPYPDVWDWVLPDRETIASFGVELHGMDTGDVLIGYGIYDKNGKYVDIQPSTFFGHLTVTDEYASQLVASSQLQLAHLSDGTSAHLESKDEAFQMILKGIPLTGGRKLKAGSFQQIGSAYASCYQGPARESYSIIDSNRKLVRSVVIFKLLDKPKRIDIGKGCISESMQSFTTRVESVDMGGLARPLADGGFVMRVDKGVLIRFDKDFHSRSPLINDKYFVLDNMIEETDDDKEPETDYWIYINRITGKRYRKGPEYPYEYQSVVDDLYNYLLSIKSDKGAAK